LKTQQIDYHDENTWKTIRSRKFDFIAHPIRAGEAVFDHLAKQFDHLQLEKKPSRRGSNSFVMIGTKKSPSPKPWF